MHSSSPSSYPAAMSRLAHQAAPRSSAWWGPIPHWSPGSPAGGKGHPGEAVQLAGLRQLLPAYRKIAGWVICTAAPAWSACPAGRRWGRRRPAGRPSGTTASGLATGALQGCRGAGRDRGASGCRHPCSWPANGPPGPAAAGCQQRHGRGGRVGRGGWLTGSTVSCSAVSVTACRARTAPWAAQAIALDSGSLPSGAIPAVVPSILVLTGPVTSRGC